MSRIRTIKPQFFLNEELAELPAMCRLLFIGLWIQADREGRLKDRPKRLKAEIFPYDNFDIDKGLKQLSEAKFIIRYKVDVNALGSVSIPEQPSNELALIQIINFSKHQKLDKVNEKESELPPPNQQDYLKTSNSLLIAGEGKGREEEGNGCVGVANAPTRTPEEEEFLEVSEWITNKAPRVMQMSEPLTYPQYLKLKSAYGADAMPKIFQAMHNWKDLTKKRVSAYLTFISFIKRDQKEVA